MDTLEFGFEHFKPPPPPELEFMKNLYTAWRHGDWALCWKVTVSVYHVLDVCGIHVHYSF